MNTFTYTARNAEEHGRVLTFTLQGEYLRINLTGLADSVSEALTGKAEEEEGDAGQKLKEQAGPTTLKVLEEISGPLHVGDVSGSLKSGQFKLTAWKRVGGLRAAPIVLNMGQVDNPEAAGAFLEELKARKGAASRISSFFGPLDYWFGWLGILLVIVFFIRRKE